MTILNLFEYFPRLEVIVRNIYWRIDFLQRKITRVPDHVKKSFDSNKKLTFDELINSLLAAGVQQNDVVLVHSSMKELSVFGLTAREVLDKLILDLCPLGTLVCPAFPYYVAEPKGSAKLKKNISNQEFLYDVQRTGPWTGELGALLMKMPRAKRSIHPLNTLVAIGNDVDFIFSTESIETLDLPCGPMSAWARLVDKNAKIIMLGVDLAHSLTMIHVAEDCYEKSWPIKTWYRERLFRIRDKGNEHVVRVRERHPRWAMAYAERKLSRDLYSSGIAQYIDVNGIPISVVETKKLINFLRSNRNKSYPYFLTFLSRL